MSATTETTDTLPCDNMPLSVKGRGKLTASATAYDDAVVVRLDDDVRSDFWAEVRLSRAELLSMLAAIGQAAE